jgi:signal transduction histidine kinase
VDQKADSIFTYILYFSLAVVFLFTFAQNIKDPWIIIVLTGFMAGSLTVRNAVIYPSEKRRNIGMLIIFLDILLVFFINRVDTGNSSGIFFYLLIGDCAIAYSAIFTGLVTFLCFVAYHISQYISLDYPSPVSLLPQIGLSSLSFIAVYAIMYLVKYEIRQRRKLAETMYELKVKTKQLENTYFKLKETSKELEELTIVSERNRIAREIHDTVGHTLTTVLLELEAGERLIPVDPPTAIQKIGLAKAQVRRGLQDIRESVKTLQSGRELMEFIPSLKLLIEETTKHGDIFIKYDIRELPQLTPAQEKAIYRALQEGLTNGIRHGKSTAFVFVLEYSNNEIKFMLQDNGKGTESVVKGFGLSTMEARVKELGGVLYVQSSEEEGFQISITIPVNNFDGGKNETDQNSNR